jgi:ribose 5-phosphate isomerase B
MKIYLGADHLGFELKNQIKDWLLQKGHEVEDCGPTEYLHGDDFIEYAVKVAQSVVQLPENRGVVICGSGAGVEIAANKIKGVRCSLGQSPEQIVKARNADDINILAIAGEFTDLEKAKKLINAFLETAYDPAERHERRINKIKELEN